MRGAARPVRLPTRSKYHAQPTVVDNIRFASKREAQRYGELKLLEKAKQIDRLELQKVFVLSVGNDPEWPEAGEVLGKYIADFFYFRRHDRTWVVEDVKGFKTPLYKWKKKHVEAQYGIEIREIR